MITRLVITLAALALASSAHAAAPTWAAVGFDPETSIMGYTTHQPTKKAAEKAALADCAYKGGGACVAVSVKGDGCVAIATGENGWAGASGKDEDTAWDAAEKACNKKTSDCSAISTQCND
jgi:hypothetical protein